MPKSLWSATTQSATSYPELRGVRRADVAIIGGGIMGTALALSLAERGTDVALLEAAEIGWGASGRNNGLIAPGLKRDPDEVLGRLGTEAGERLLRFSGRAPHCVFKFVDRNSIDCDANQNGWIQAAHSQRALSLIEKRAQQWQDLGAATEMITADTLASRLGTDYYAGASFDPRGGSVNPLAYVHGLASAASSAGAKLFEHSPASRVEKRSGLFAVDTDQGSLHADNVVCCTNAYGNRIEQIRGTVIPLRTAQVASAPLSEDQAKTILPGRESASDTQRLLTSFRLTADKRLIMGGASATAGDHSPALLGHLHRAARVRFPGLGEIQWQYGWSGYLALTRDHLPCIFDLGNGFYAGTACNGRGIAMATVTGFEIAKLVCGQDEKDCNVPVRKPKRIPGFGLRHAGVAAGVLFNRLLDNAERSLGG